MSSIEVQMYYDETNNKDELTTKYNCNYFYIFTEFQALKSVNHNNMQYSRIITLFFFCISSLAALSQQDIRVFSEPDNFKKGYRIMAEKTKPGTYTCTVTFKQLVGYNCSEGSTEFTATITNYGAQQIALITPIENASSFSLNYSYSYTRGKNISKLDSLFPHLLPIQVGKNMQTSGVYFVGDLIGKNNANFYAMGFKYQLGDTICATRAGIVYDFFDKAEARHENELFSTKTRNSIYLEHGDGTMSKYNILSSIKVLVTLGEKVLPGQPLAVFDKPEKDYTMLLNIFYLNLKSKATNGSNYFDIRPRFVLSKDNTNLAVANTLYPLVLHPIEIITKELSNKEIKKLGLKN
jgi:hypothetical protein